MTIQNICDIVTILDTVALYAYAFWPRKVKP